MDEMEIDFDLDADEDPEIARLQAEAAAINARAQADNAEVMNGVEEAKEEGEFDPDETQPTKVHVRGVDQLNHHQVEQWVGEHVPTDLFRKVEWVDDTSANLVFDTEVAATDALNALSAVEVGEPLELRKAKELSTHPDVGLQVRGAIVTDVKVKNAKDVSRFYLHNPEWDPENPNNVRPNNRKRRWQDDGGRDRYNKYRIRDWEDDRYPRRGSGDKGNFTEDMYDDGAGTASAPPEIRRASSGGEGRRLVKFDDDLFAPQQYGRLRDRSASPSKDGDGRYGFSDDNQPRRRTARPRSVTPPSVRKNRENRAVQQVMRKELFPDKPATSNGHFSDRPSTPTSSAKVPRELFPENSGTPNHRRQDGRDLPLDEVVHFMGEYTLDGVRASVDQHRAYRSSHFSGARPSSSHSHPTDRHQPRDLFARTSNAGESGRLNRDGDDDVGIMIRGTAKASDAGFSFLGASRDGARSAENPLVKELFPLKSGAKKDLFDGRIKGRASGRRRAEDLF